MSRLHRYINHYHPGYLRKAAYWAARKAGEVYASYQAHKRVSRVPITINSLSSGSDMPPTKKTPRRRSNSAPSSAKAPKKFNPMRKGKVNPKRLARNLFKTGNSFANVHETGYVGRFRKPRVQRRKRAAAFDKYGAVLKREYNFGGTSVADTQCVYIGHGFPVSQAVYQMVRCVYRTVLNLGGYDFQDWNDEFEGNAMNLGITWSIGQGTVTPGASVDFPTIGALTHYEISTKLCQNIEAAITDATALDAINLSIATLSTAIGGPFVPLVRLNLQQYMINIDYWSILKVKNVSLATESEGDHDGDLATNVNAQPLVGRLYRTKGWANGFRLAKEAGGAGALVATPDAGSIAYGADTWTLTNQNTFRKPPPAYVFGVNKTAPQRMNPGEIKSDVIKWKARMSISTLFTKLIANVNNLANGGDYRDIGCASMFAFEREVALGSAATTIQLLGQIDFVLKMKGFTQKSKVPPITTT